MPKFLQTPEILSSLQMDNPFIGPIQSEPISKSNPLVNSVVKEDDGNCDIPNEMEGEATVLIQSKMKIPSFIPGGNQIRRLPVVPGASGISKTSLDLFKSQKTIKIPPGRSISPVKRYKIEIEKYNTNSQMQEETKGCVIAVQIHKVNTNVSVAENKIIEENINNGGMDSNSIINSPDETKDNSK